MVLREKPVKEAEISLSSATAIELVNRINPLEHGAEFRFEIALQFLGNATIKENHEGVVKALQNKFTKICESGITGLDLLSQLNEKTRHAIYRQRPQKQEQPKERHPAITVHDEPQTALAG